MNWQENSRIALAGIALLGTGFVGVKHENSQTPLVPDINALQGIQVMDANRIYITAGENPLPVEKPFTKTDFGKSFDNLFMKANGISKIAPVTDLNGTHEMANFKADDETYSLRSGIATGFYPHLEGESFDPKVNRVFRSLVKTEKTPDGSFMTVTSYNVVSGLAPNTVTDFFEKSPTGEYTLVSREVDRLVPNAMRDAINSADFAFESTPQGFVRERKIA